MFARRLCRSSCRIISSSNIEQCRSALFQQCTAATARMVQKDKAFKKMEEEGIPKDDSISSAALPEKGEEKLFKLSPQEFKVYNYMAEHMDMFHNHFRQTWNTLHTACTTGKRPSGMSIRQFLQLASEFCHHLTLHHTIEEQHIFPVLAKKIPYFEPKNHLLTQHQGIHDGIEKLEEYVADCKSGETELRLEEMGKVLDGFGQVLWSHLEDEVRTLGAENMRKYWSVDEMRRMPM